MDYLRVYRNIVERGQVREPEPGVYYEVHHIIPTCIREDNSPENLTTLTAREHFIAHWLLVRAYPDNGLLANAFWLMSNPKKSGRTYRVSSRAYAEARERHSECMTERWANSEYKENTGSAISASLEKKWQDPEFKNKMQDIWQDPEFKNKMKDIWQDPERRERHSQRMQDIWQDPEHRERHSQGLQDIWQDPELREAESERKKSQWQDPGFRQKMEVRDKEHSERMKKIWAERRNKK